MLQSVLLVRPTFPLQSERSMPRDAHGLPVLTSRLFYRRGMACWLVPRCSELLDLLSPNVKFTKGLASPRPSINWRQLADEMQTISRNMLDVICWISSSPTQFTFALPCSALATPIPCKPRVCRRVCRNFPPIGQPIIRDRDTPVGEFRCIHWSPSFWFWIWQDYWVSTWGRPQIVFTPET